jgi:hypothetical protein
MTDAPTYARPLSPDDQDALTGIDAAYAAAFGLEPLISKSSVSFYVRTGHAFVAVRGAAPVGFVFAQAVWNGTRPTVYAARLAVADPADEGAREALLEALTKSAYDAAVYDLQVQVPEADGEASRALSAKRYAPLAERLYNRRLGSRGQPSA